jgi:hypothetical protein
MSGIGKQGALVVCMLLLAVSTVVPVRAQKAGAALDATLFTNYEVLPGLESVSWFVCGSLPDSYGCYGSGTLGPFGYVGALMEGNPSTKGNTVTRTIYALDVGAGSNKTSVILYIYQKTDTITSSNDSVSVTLSKTIDLSLTGGSAALISMAANSKFLFVGTNQGGVAIQIQKNNLKQTEIIDQSSGGAVVTAITMDQYGYVTVNWGDTDGESTANSVYNPDGELVQYGGGGEFMLNTMQAILTSTLHVPN